jgi:hypothetical protein
MRIESYLAEHKVNVTHALCESCEQLHFQGQHAER